VFTSVAAVVFLTFWAAVPWLRHSWIDEEDEEDDEQAAAGASKEFWSGGVQGRYNS
jgi:hypothetical protein